MVNDCEKLDKAKMVLQKIAKGIDPLTGELIKEESFLNDPRIIRCFYYVTEILDNVRNGTYNRGPNKCAHFIITPEQKSKVEFPESKIGVNEFSRCINMCLDINISKKLSGMELNKRLKKLGVLSESETSDGKTRTVTNETSAGYGFEMEKKMFNGNEYEMVVINDKGKKYLLDNIETIMEIGDIPQQG